jgi:Rap guanine nucleotide exchange factor 4
MVHLAVHSTQQAFKDKVFLYRFRVDEDGSGTSPSADEISQANDYIKESVPSLLHRASDATLRLILRKP